MNKVLTDSADISDEELREYHDNNRARFIAPSRIRASHILVSSKIEAVKVGIDLNEGRDFAAVAMEYSLDAPTREIGGDIGYFALGTLIPEFESACMALEVGEVSDPVKTVLGFHIIKLTDKAAARELTFEEAGEDVLTEMTMDRQVNLYDVLIARLRKQSEIEYK